MKLFTFILGGAVFLGCIILIVVEEVCSPQIAEAFTLAWGGVAVIWALCVLLLTFKMKTYE